MARLTELIEVHLKETDAVISQSSLLLQKKEGGQSGELKSSGNLVENFVKDFIEKISPSGIKVTSGYIVNPKTFKEKTNLPQHDIILSNRMSAPLFSIIDGQIEIVPIESMVGIIEVKRTLTSESIKNAQNQIRNSYENVIKEYRTKEEENNTLSITTQPGTTSPLFGIIGLTSELTLNDINSIIDPNLIDFVWAFNHNESFVFGDFNGQSTGTVSRKGLKQPRMLSVKGEKAIVFSKLKGHLTLWLSRLASLWIKTESIKGYYIDIWDEKK
jgi:hypothetical protein